MVKCFSRDLLFLHGPLTMGRKGKQEKRNSRSQAAQADTQKPAEASATAPGMICASSGALTH